MKRADKRQLLVEHYLDFYSAAYAMLRDEDDAKDAVQEALVRTLVQHGVDDVRNYCMRVVKHLCIDILRRRKTLVSLDSVTLVADLDNDELLRLVEKKKKELSPVEKALLELHHEEGYTLSEVAAMLGVSISSTNRLLAAARKKLKEKIEQEI